MHPSELVKHTGHITIMYLDGTKELIQAFSSKAVFGHIQANGKVSLYDGWVWGTGEDWHFHPDTKSWKRTKPKEQPKKFTLMVSASLGAHYDPVCGVDDMNDAEMQRHILYCNQNHLRYYVEGDKSVVCPMHQVTIDELGQKHHGYVCDSSTQAQVDRLRSKFCK